jgi:hypothetical protein
MYTPRQLGSRITRPVDEDHGGKAVSLGNGLLIDEEVAMELKRFFDAAIDDLEQLRRDAKNHMRNRRLYERWNRNDRRIRNQPEIWLQDDGDVDPRSPDGHLEMGVSTGLMPTAVAVASSYENQAYLERNPRFFAFKPIGLTQEGKSLAQALDVFVEWHFNEIGFDKILRRRSLMKYKHGSAFLQMEMIQPIEVKQDEETGAWEERAGEIMPAITLLPIKNLIPSSLNEPYAEKQDGVFVIARNVTVDALEKSEAVYEPQMDPTGQVVIGYKKTGGYYFNLEAMRSVMSGGNKNYFSSGEDDDSPWSREADNLHNRPSFDLIKWRGTMSPDVLDKLTPRAARHLGIDVGIEDFDPDDRDMRREFTARLARLRHWYLYYPRPENNMAVENGDSMVVGFGLAPFENNSIYAYRFADDDEEFFGMGICDLGDGVERMHDGLSNAQYRIGLLNSNPPVAVDRGAILEETKRQIRDLLHPRSIIDKKPGAKLAEFIEVLRVTADPNLDRWIANLEAKFWQVVRVPKSLVGYANAATLGQDELNVAQGKNLLDDSILGSSKEDHRLIRDMIEQLWIALGPEGFMERMRKIAGMHAIEIEKDIVSTDQIWREFKLTHSATMGKDPVVLAAQMDAKFQAYPGVFDPVRVGLASMTMAGYVEAEDFLAAGWPVLKPKEEEKQMSLGHRMMPNPRMDVATLIEHIQSHIMALRDMETGQSEYDPREQAALSEGINNYLEIAFLLLQAQLGPMGSALNGGGGAAPAGVQAPPGGERAAKRGIERKAGGKGNPAERESAAA